MPETVNLAKQAAAQTLPGVQFPTKSTNNYVILFLGNVISLFPTQAKPLSSVRPIVLGHHHGA